MNDSQHEHADGITEAHKPVPSYFYVLFFGLIIWAVIFMAYFLLSGWSSDAEFQEKMAAHTGEPVQATAEPAASAPAAEPAGSAPGGQALYSANCAGCHGADATGGFGTDLTAATYQYGKTPDDIKESISNGRGGSMPGFSGQLSPAEIDQLVDYLLKL